MKTRSVYDPGTGIFTGEVLTCSEDQLKPNARGAMIGGRFDRLSQRVNIETGDVVDYKPPAPDDRYEWRENVANGRPRWVKRVDVAEREGRDLAARQKIAELETQQIRSMRELMLDPNDPSPRERLRSIEKQIVDCRADLIR